MASDDETVSPPPPVSHSEGTSYAVAFGDPSQHPVPGTDTYGNFCPAFPAAGGMNPYEPERGDLAVLTKALEDLEDSIRPSPELIFQTSAALSVYIYDGLRGVSERSRGVTSVDMFLHTVETNPETESVIENFMNATNKWDCLFLTFSLVCLWRMCHCDGTVVAFSAEPDLVVFTDNDIKLSSLCFNLSARERNRLRPIRRMPHIISRELMKKKVALERLSVDSGVESELSAEAEIGAFVFMTESNDLWRVVVSFL